MKVKSPGRKGRHWEEGPAVSRLFHIRRGNVVSLTPASPEAEAGAIDRSSVTDTSCL